MIRSITMKGFKEQNTVQQLTGKDIIIGPNGVGKTARQQAIGISLLGYCPGNGKTPAETHKMATADQMSVGLALDGFEFNRSFVKSEKPDKRDGFETKISQKINVSPSRGEKNDTQKAARIGAECGNFPVMLDFGEFLSMSDAKRRDFFYNLSPITTSRWTRDAVDIYLSDNLLTLELKVNDYDRFCILTDLIAQAMGQFPADYSAQDGLRSMLDWVKVQQSHWNSEKKNAEGAVRKLADLKNELAETDRNIATNKQDMESLQNQHLEVEKQLAGDREKKKAIEKRLARIDELCRLIEEVSQEISQLPVNNNDIEQQILELTATIAEVSNGEEIDKLMVEQESINQKLQDTIKRKQELYKEVGDAEGLNRSLGATVKSINGTLKNVSGQEVKVCLISPLLKCEKDFTPYLDYVKKQQEQNKELVSEKTAEVGQLETTEKELGDRVKAIQKEIAQVNKNDGEIAKKNDQARKAIAALEKMINERETKRQQLQNKQAMYQADLDLLQAEKVDPIAPLDAMEMRSEGLSNQIKALKEKLAEQEKAKITLSNLRSSMIDSKQAAYKYDGFKALADAIGPKGLQGELVKEILSPIQDAIQGNLNLMGIEHRFYFQTESDTGKEVFQFGWINDKGRHVNFDALSTGQQIILLIAVMVTLLERSNPPLKVLSIDNIENLDRENFRKAIAGMDALAHKLDNIILSGVIEVEPEEVPGWNVCDLGAVSHEEVRAHGAA